MLDIANMGAGPTDLLLESELMLGGVRVLGVERRTQLDVTLKAGGIGALAGEVSLLGEQDSVPTLFRVTSSRASARRVPVRARLGTPGQDQRKGSRA